MSHFSVLVVTTEEPTDAVLKRVLQPYHEYECTDVDDEYVIDVDVDDEVRSNYAAYTYTRWRDVDGKLHDPYEDRFYRDLTPAEKAEHGPMMGTGCGGGKSWSSRDWSDGLGYRAKMHLTPEEAGMVELKVPASEVEPIEAWAIDYGGWTLGQNGRFFKHTNPNSKWDWWTLGGRYNGRLMTVPGASGAKGRGGLMTPVKDTGFDSCRRDHLDFDAMKRMRETERSEWLASSVSKAGLSPSQVDDAFWALAEFHAEWKNLPEPRPRGREYSAWIAKHGERGAIAAKLNDADFDLPDIKPGQAASAWVSAAPALTAFALVKDGEWHESGSMGWFGCVSDPKDAAAWEAFVSDTVRNLQISSWLSIVDCHI